MNTPTQPGVTSKLTEGALNPLVQIMNKDIKQGCPQYWALWGTTVTSHQLNLIQFTTTPWLWPSRQFFYGTALRLWGSDVSAQACCRESNGVPYKNIKIPPVILETSRTLIWNGCVIKRMGIALAIPIKWAEEMTGRDYLTSFIMEDVKWSVHGQNIST